MPGTAAPGRALLRQWSRLRGVPGGDRIFSAMLGLRVPYSGTTGAVVRLLEPGRALVELRDRRRVRNHLGSVHAVALLNLGELASGLALITALPSGMRGIVLHLEADYVRKARGRLVADCRAPSPAAGVEAEVEVEAAIVDTAGEVVSTVRARWLVSPVREDRDVT